MTEQNVERYWLRRLKKYKDESASKGLPLELLADRDFMLKAVKVNSYVLKYASDELKNDKEIVLAAIESDKWNFFAKSLEYASDELKDDENIVMTAVKRCGEALCFASNRLKHDRDVVMAAVAQCGWALQYASDELKNDEEVVLTAIQGWDGVSCNYSYAIEYASEELRSNKEFMRKVIELTEGEAFCGATEELKNDKEMVLFAVRHCSPPHQFDPDVVLRYASEEMRADKDVVLTAVRRNGWSLKYASEELKADKDVVLVATINNPWSLTCASPTLRGNKEFILELVKRDGGWVLRYVDEALQNDVDILNASKRHTPKTGCCFEYYGMNKIIIPATVTNFEQYDLLRNIDFKRNIEGIIVEEGNPVYHSAGNCLIETESKTLVLGCKNSIIPDDGSVEIIEYCAFAECEGLKSLHIPASVKVINRAFGGFCGVGTCYDLESITVSPDSTYFYSINDEVLISNYTWDEEQPCIVFVGKNVKNFTWPANVCGYFDGAFSACSGLENLSVDPENPWLYSVNNCVVDRENSLLLTCCNSSVIPDDGSIIDICSGAFSGVKLKSLHIPASIGEMLYDDNIAPFTGCLGIENITVSDGNQYYCSINNCLIEKVNQYLVYGGKSCIIPNDGSVESIANEAFFGAEFTNITIPSPISVIASLAFGNCSNLTTVVMSNSVKHIEMTAFSGCSRLSRVFYLGTESDRENIVIEIEDEPINFATWFYYSEEKPEEEGNYWHYVNGEPTVW